MATNTPALLKTATEDVIKAVNEALGPDVGPRQKLQILLLAICKQEEGTAADKDTFKDNLVLSKDKLESLGGTQLMDAFKTFRTPIL